MQPSEMIRATGYEGALAGRIAIQEQAMRETAALGYQQMQAGSWFGVGPTEKPFAPQEGYKVSYAMENTTAWKNLVPAIMKADEAASGFNKITLENMSSTQDFNRVITDGNKTLLEYTATYGDLENVGGNLVAGTGRLIAINGESISVFTRMKAAMHGVSAETQTVSDMLNVQARAMMNVQIRSQILASTGLFLLAQGFFLLISSKSGVVQTLGAIAVALGIAAVAAWGLAAGLNVVTIGLAAAAAIGTMALMYAAQRIQQEQMERDQAAQAAKIGQYKMGGFVEKTGLALVHKNEFVIPKLSSSVMSFKKPEMVRETGLAYLRKDDYVVPVKSTAISPIISRKKKEKLLPTYQTGGLVKDSGLAVVHKNEYVIPRSSNITTNVLNDIISKVATDKKVSEKVSMEKELSDRTQKESISKRVMDFVFKNVSDKTITTTEEKNKTETSDLIISNLFKASVSKAYEKNISESESIDNIISSMSVNDSKTIRKTIDNVTNELMNYIKQETINRTTSVMKNILFPSYQKGGTVKDTGLVIIHKGEYIVPKEDSVTMSKIMRSEQITDMISDITSKTNDKKLTKKTAMFVSNVIKNISTENIEESIFRGVSRNRVSSDTISNIINDDAISRSVKMRNLTNIISNIVTRTDDSRVVEELQNISSNVSLSKTAKTKFINDVISNIDSSNIETIQTTVDKVTKQRIVNLAENILYAKHPTLKSLPEYQKGGMVKKTGLAIVHKDEYIVPKLAAQSKPIETKESTTNNVNYDYRVIHIYDPSKIDLQRAMREAGKG
jgi:hypothetical protein